MIEWMCMQDKMPKQLSSTVRPVIRHTNALQESAPSNPPNIGAALSISPEGGDRSRLVNLTLVAVRVDATGEPDLEYDQA